MKILNKMVKSVALLLVVLIQFIFIPVREVYAATDPDLGVAAGYSVFGNAGITETGAQTSHLWGDVGDNGLGHASLIASQVDGTLYSIDQSTIVSAISAAYGNLAGEAQTGAIDLAASPTVGPGVYDIAATAFNSTLTLDGAGVYIFRSTSSIAQTEGGTMNLINGATACNIYWQIPVSMTFAAIGNIEGTIITNTGLISFVSGVSLKGRAWAATQVTMDNNQITQPTCAAAATPPPLVCSGTQHLNAGSTQCVDYSVPDSGQPGGGTTSTGQVLGASTLAATGDGNSKVGILLMILGSALALGSLYTFKKSSF